MKNPALKSEIKLLKKHLAAVARLRDPFQNRESLLEVESYIFNELRSFGYEVKIDPFQFDEMEFHNLMAHSPSSKEAKWIIGAHFDAVPGTDGADDNASGVACLLESARLLVHSKSVSEIDFLFFNLEEDGMIGSSHYVSRLKRNKTKIQGMLSLEMVGYTSQEKGSQKMPLLLKPFYPDRGNFLALVGDTQSKTLLEKTKKAFKQVPELPVETLTVPAKGWAFPETRLSDHSPFWDASYPALLVTDTSFFRNPHYHTSSDRVETLDLNFMARVTEGVIQFANNFI